MEVAASTPISAAEKRAQAAENGLRMAEILEAGGRGVLYLCGRANSVCSTRSLAGLRLLTLAMLLFSLNRDPRK
jgi:hypothetical protein